jgi:hypothetical protein
MITVTKVRMNAAEPPTMAPKINLLSNNHDDGLSVLFVGCSSAIDDVAVFFEATKTMRFIYIYIYICIVIVLCRFIVIYWYIYIGYYYIYFVLCI